MSGSSMVAIPLSAWPSPPALGEPGCVSARSSAAGDCPVTFVGSRRQIQTTSGVLDQQAGEIAKLDDLCLDRLLDCKLGQGVVERYQVLLGLCEGEAFIKIDPLSVAAMLRSGFSP